MNDNTSTEVHFSRAAALYHDRAELQRTVAGQLLHFLSGPLEAGRILELGCGTGFLTAHLREEFAHAQIDAIDISGRMIEQARKLLGPSEQIRWQVGDVRDYQAPALYDLIASSSSLQWMQPLDELFCRLAEWLKPGGRLLCSLMVEGTLGELHRLRGEIAPHKSPRDRLPTIAGTTTALRHAGFRIARSEEEILQTTHPSVADLLRSIRALGFTGGPLATSSPLLTRGELKRLAERYTLACALPYGKITATYVVYYFEAMKPITS